ncbi:MAG: hypothetical protein HFE47_02920 [Clostridia bacterium]|nr:hypothetical protein [Clostridia bacterium]
MTEEMKEEQARRQLAYEDAIKGKTDEEILAVNYFFNKQTKKGCVRKHDIPAVTDEQFDELVSKRANEITSQGVLAAMGLTTPPVWIIDPLKVCTPEFEDAEYVRMGADDKARTSRITTTFLLYAQDIMYIYTRTVSLTDRFCDETSASILYKDITSVSLNTVTTEVRHDVLEAGGCMRKAKEIPVWIPGTTNTVSFTVPGKTYTVNVGGAKAVMTAAVANLRAKIAESKKK